MAAGLRQIVLLGAGFDARAMRMTEIAAARARVFEVDFAEQLSRKRALLAAAGVPAWPGVLDVACDFAAPDFDTRLEAQMAAAGFELYRGAIFVWEGVIGYIDDDAIDRSLALMARVGGRGSRVVFTFGEGSFDPQTPGQRTARMGFSACEEFGLDAVWRRYLPGEPPAYAGVSRVGVAVV